jgi:predicted amidophosphoribosyltransferase
MADRRQCPFCDTTTTVPTCEYCGRDVTAPRRPCKTCGRWSPKTESECIHCGARYVSEWVWKIPLMIALVIAALAASICLGVLDT